jgi:hypothetical protein
MDGVSVPRAPRAPRAPRSAGSATKRVMRRPYKSMLEVNLISKRTMLREKLDVLRTRMDTWNSKVDKYTFELDARSSVVEEAADNTSVVEEQPV